MDKLIFALKLIPCRHDFAQTMTHEEREIMQQHVYYWKELMKNGFVIVFGPVIDPKGIYGLGIISVTDESQVIEFIKNDPASKINQYEYFLMKATLPNNCD